MTAAQTSHLIEQFSAQAPFAIWITDSRGVAIFANHKLHELFGIAEKPSGAIGMNLFEEPGIEKLGLKNLGERLRKGETIDQTIELPGGMKSDKIVSQHEGALTVRIVGYPLMSSSQTIEHYVIIITDLTDGIVRHKARRTQLKDIEVYNVTKKTRLAKEQQLRAEVAKLEDDLRAIGGTP